MNDGNFKIKVLENDKDNWVTKGNIYEFKEGRTTWNTGDSSASYSDFESLMCNCTWLKAKEINKESEATYDKLFHSPVSYIRLDGVNEEYFTKTLKEDKPIIFTSEQRSFTYDRIPKMISWLQDVYDYCTKLKNKVEYVDFNIAKEYMLKGNKTKFEDETYYIKDNELYCEELKSACALKLRAIESDKWILL